MAEMTGLEGFKQTYMQILSKILENSGAVKLNSLTQKRGSKIPFSSLWLKDVLLYFEGYKEFFNLYKLSLEHVTNIFEEKEVLSFPDLTKEIKDKYYRDPMYTDFKTTVTDIINKWKSHVTKEKDIRLLLKTIWDIRQTYKLRPDIVSSKELTDELQKSKYLDYHKSLLVIKKLLESNKDVDASKQTNEDTLPKENSSISDITRKSTIKDEQPQEKNSDENDDDDVVAPTTVKQSSMKVADRQQGVDDQLGCNIEYKSTQTDIPEIEKVDVEVQTTEEMPRFESQTIISTLQADKKKLTDEHTRLQEEKRVLTKEYTSISSLPDGKAKEQLALLKKEMQTLRKQNEQLEEQRVQLEKQYKKLLKEKEEFEKGISRNRPQTAPMNVTKYRDLENQNEALKNEKESLMQRLSMVAGLKMKDNNPTIADLSDPNRPEKLAEQFKEIYDNAWTDILDYISENNKVTEEIAVQQIVNALQIIFQQCAGKIKRNQRRLIKIIGYPENALENQRTGGKAEHDPVLKIVKNLVQGSAERICDDVTKDPPVILNFECKNGDPFNKDKFSPFTISGDIVDYLVWPVMYLSENGIIMSKGIAQGKKKE